MQVAEEEQLDEHLQARSTHRRVLQVTATVALATATIAVMGVALVDSTPGGGAYLLLGSLPSRHIVGIATIVAFTAIGYMLCSVSVPSGWLAPVVVARVLSISAALLAAFWGVLTTPWPVTSLLVNGCESGYVVEEQSFLYLSSITVLEKDGLVATPVVHASADDGHQPFAAGEYGAWVADGHLEGWFSRERGSNTALNRFELPLLQSADCR